MNATDPQGVRLLVHSEPPVPGQGCRPSQQPFSIPGGGCGPLTDKEAGIRGGHSLGKSWDRRRPRGVLACVPATSGSACHNSGA